MLRQRQNRVVISEEALLVVSWVGPQRAACLFRDSLDPLQ
jgi:hypothetical protein